MTEYYNVNISECQKTVENVVQHIRDNYEKNKYGYNLQECVSKVIKCQIRKKYADTPHLSGSVIPKYWYALRFDNKDDYLMFLIKWS